MVLPAPPHLGQADCWAKVPKAVCRVVRTVPVPPQLEQVSGVQPSAQPEPWHLAHSSMTGTVISFSTPKAASSKVIST